jgi:hypothetical protein
MTTQTKEQKAIMNKIKQVEGMLKNIQEQEIRMKNLLIELGDDWEKAGQENN